MLSLVAQGASGSSDFLLSAMLDADPYLGCPPGGSQSDRENKELRRLIAAKKVQPSITSYQIDVDFDDPAHRCLNPAEYDSIHPALTAELFPVNRRGRLTIDVFEIQPGYAMTTACQVRLIKNLKLKKPCVAVSRTAIDVRLRYAEYPVTALCGCEFTLSQTQTAIASLLQVSGGRILRPNQPTERWSQHFSILAEALDEAA